MLGAAASAAALLAACGGGGGGKKAEPPKPPSVQAVADTRTVQGTTGESLLAFRFALIDSPLYPLSVGYRITGGAPGASCAGGVDYYVAPASGLSVTTSASEASGTLTIANAAAARQINVIACPGASTSTKTLTLNWTEATAGGAATGAIRGSGNTGLADAKVLNDTGITTCATDSANGQVCAQSAFPGQDAERGRDASAAITGSGGSRTTAFAFTKLPAGDCIQDNVTGLVWEGKTDAGDLRDKDNTYTWYSSDAGTNGGNAGTAAAGSCTGSACDTESYVTAMNTARLCGFGDWRLPTAEELASLLDLSVASGASVNSAIANQQASVYWSATPRSTDVNSAVGVDFDTGVAGGFGKNTAAHIRLVRGR